MNFLFRVNASSEIGFGHMYRCVSLANELKRRGHHVAFISCVPERDRKFLPHGILGHTVYYVDSNDHLNEMTKSNLGNLLENHEVDWLIVDSYEIGYEQEKAWSERLSSKVVVIDDYPQRHHFCDILINQNLNDDASIYSDYLKSSSLCLLGPRYALLRQDFYQHREKKIADQRVFEKNRVEKVLINLGGGDYSSLLEQALRSCMDSKVLKKARFIVVANLSRRKKADLNCLLSKERISFMEKVDDMAELMVDCDLAIGACGSSSWERCCLGLPALMIVLADNQRAIGASLEKKGVGKLLQPKEMVNLDEILENIDLREMSSRAMSIVDGLGASRVVDQILMEA